MQSKIHVPAGFAKQSHFIPFESVICALGVLAAVVAMGAWQTYTGFEILFEFTGRETEVWFGVGPLSLFVASALGFLFGFIAVLAKHAATQKFWLLLLWLPMLWLAIGSLVFTCIDLRGGGFKSFASEHLWSCLTVTLPMAIGAACLLNISALIRMKSPSPVVERATRWRAIGAVAGRVSMWVSGTLGSMLVILVSAFLLLLASCEPPSLTTLAGSFPSERRDLETIVQMSDADSDFSVIDPGWLNSSAGLVIAAEPEALSTSPVLVGPANADADENPRSHMSVERWNEYRRLFKRNRITQGIRRSRPNGDAFIIVKSVGLLDNGYSNGYLYCGPGPEHPYRPCSSTETNGSHPSTANDEAYSFIKLADRWYAYSEGPS